MKKILVFFLFAGLLAAPLYAQTAPAQNFAWTAPVASSTQLGCGTAGTNTVVCSYRLFRAAGACPAALPTWPTIPTTAPPAGWTQILVTALNQLAATDTTTAYSTTYAYAVTAISPATATVQSQPSSCITVTTVAPPPPSVLGAPTGLKQANVTAADVDMPPPYRDRKVMANLEQDGHIVSNDGKTIIIQ